MSSIPFSGALYRPSQSLITQPKTNTRLTSLSPSRPCSVAFLGPTIRSSVGSSNSAFLRHGFSFPSLVVSGSRLKLRPFGVYARAATGKTLHDFTVKDIDGENVSLSKFKGKILLVVNVASRCGLTSSNYAELSHLYEKYKTQGFEILAFPCNQFGGQEPGSNPQIKNFACTRFKAEFPIFDKVDVNGPNTAPVYQFLKSSARTFLGDLIKWNFEKFLVDKNGKVVERYPPPISPFQIELWTGILMVASIHYLNVAHYYPEIQKDIQKLLAA